MIVNQQYNGKLKLTLIETGCYYCSSNDVMCYIVKANNLNRPIAFIEAIGYYYMTVINI